jgi:hypothetical protein
MRLVARKEGASVAFDGVKVLSVDVADDVEILMTVRLGARRRCGPLHLSSCHIKTV